MSIAIKTFIHVEAAIGGEIVRFDVVNTDGTARALNMGSNAKDDKVENLLDLATPQTKTLWDATKSHLLSPLAFFFNLDPENLFRDNLSRAAFTSGSAPVATLEIFTADAVGGTLVNTGTATAPAVQNEASKLVIDLYREVPMILPGCGCRSTVSATSQDRAISKILARSNLASGFGGVRIRSLPFQ